MPYAKPAMPARYATEMAAVSLYWCAQLTELVSRMAAAGRARAVDTHHVAEDVGQQWGQYRS